MIALKYLVYPYCESLYPLISNYKAFVDDDIEIQNAVCPVSWSKSIRSFFSERINITYEYEDILKKSDGVIILCGSDKSYMKDDIKSKIIVALNESKNVICFMSLSQEEQKMFVKEAFRHNCKFDYRDVVVSNKDHLWSYQSPSAIVVGIGDMLRNMDDLTVLINTAKKFKELGYRVSVITSNRLCSFLNFNILPEELYCKMPFELSVRQINNFVIKTQLREQPDIILLHFPDAMVRYSNACPENFSIKAFIISQAVSFDYFILNTFVENITANNYEELSNVFKYRFGFDINFCTVDYLQVDSSSSNEKESVCFLDIPAELVREYANSLNLASKRIKFKVIDDSCTAVHIVEDVISILS